MKKIEIKGTNLFTLVDDDLFEQLNKYSWRLSSGYVRRATTIRINGVKKPTTILMHRDIMCAVKGQIVDHINGDKLDNRRENMRFVTMNQSNQNRKAQGNKETGFKGVYIKKGKYRENKPYEVRIHVDKKTIFGGLFSTPEEAAKRYDELAKEHHGEYARLNFKKE